MSFLPNTLQLVGTGHRVYVVTDGPPGVTNPAAFDGASVCDRAVFEALLVKALADLRAEVTP